MHRGERKGPARVTTLCYDMMVLFIYSRWILPLAMAACCLGIVACDKPPPGGLRMYPVGAPELARASVDPTSHIWESAPLTGANLLPFPARAQVLVEHSLGRTPRNIQCYLSFVQMGGSPALAAGDLCRVVGADDQSVTVWNDTNGNFFVRITAQ